MKNRIVLFCALTAILTVLAGSRIGEAQTTAKKTVKTSATNEQQTLQEIQQLEKSLREAFLEGKTFWWEHHLEEHYSGLNPDGQSADRAGAIQLYQSSDVKYDEVNIREMNARIYGDCAISTGKGEVSGNYKGQPFNGDYYFVHVWIKQGPDWKLAEAQATKLSN